MTSHGRADEYLEGTLSSDEEAAFLDHVIDCPACQAALGRDLQLRDLEDIAREQSAATVEQPSTPLQLAAAPPAPPAPAEPVAPDPAPANLLVLAELVIPAPAQATPLAPAHGPAVPFVESPRPMPAEAWPAPIAVPFEPAPAVEPQPRDDLAQKRAMAARRGRKRSGWVAVLATAAAAAAAVMVWRVVPPHPTESPTLALAPTRSIEARLGYPPAAAAYRKYDVPRGSARHETISSEAIAPFERTGDCRGVAAAHVLNGDLGGADERYANCSASAELDADRAGLAVLRGHPEEALRLADLALVAHPDLPVALWNRALALDKLGLGLAAAEDFDRVAELDAAWAEEARARAAALRRPLTELRDSWKRTMDAGDAMTADGPPIAADLARRHPARARTFLHHAIRTARTRARLDELRPLAAALEGLAGSELASYIDRAAARLTPARLALIDDYAAMVRAESAPDDARFHAWLDRARAAGAGDLILGALDVTSRVGDATDEATRLAVATGDPWFELAVLVDRAAVARESGRLAEAAALLDEGDRRCAARSPAYRCLQLTLERARLETDRYHPPAVRTLSVIALREATELGEWGYRMYAAHRAGEAERFRDNFAVARGFYRESALGDGSCLARRSMTALFGEMSFDEHRIRDAREAAGSLPACDTPPNLIELELEADLLRAGVLVRGRAALVADLTAARGRADRSKLRYFDYLIARAELGQVADAPVRLRSIAAEALARPSDTAAARLGTAAAAAALVDAGSRQAWSEVLEIAAEVRGVEVPRRCAVVIAADDFQLVGAAVGPAGELVGVYLPDVTPPAEWRAPATLGGRIQGCELVDVLAAPPWLGVGPLLDSAVPWRYVLGPPHVPSQGAPRRVIVADPRPPASLGLAALAPWSAAPPGAQLITGTAATPERLVAVARDATILEIHAHTDRIASSDAPALALSEGRTGWAVTAEAVREMHLDRTPVVVLADCVGAVPARYAHTSWGLPAAFLGAGAGAVIAALAPIPDAAATPFFAGIVAELESGIPVAAAVAHARTAALARDPTSWARHVVVFE